MRTFGKIVLVAGAAVAAVVIGGAVVGTNPPAADSASSAAAEAPAALPTYKDKVRDGQFEFTVINKKDSIPIPESLLFQKPHGVYAQVVVKVENIGDSKQDLFSEWQTAYIKNRKYTATLFSDGSAMLTLNPGQSATIAIVYDVPKGSKLQKIELHDSLLSGGVTVKL